MTPPFLRDESGNLRLVYPCSRCGRDVPIYDDFRLVDLKRLGWLLFMPTAYVNRMTRLWTRLLGERAVVQVPNLMELAEEDTEVHS
jgi:hypothetical protein